MTLFHPGLYRHYKGGLYVALGLVMHHEKRMPMVHYVSREHGSSNVRPLVGWPGDPDGFNDLVEVGGVNVARFTFVGEANDLPLEERPELYEEARNSW